jgi:heme-degrading monooxygenase HmoA
MICRVWHGWTLRANADAYEKFLHEHMLPGMHRVKGFRGAQVLRRDVKDRDDVKDKKDEVEFIVITRFNSIEAVKEFAGEDYEVAVVEPEARQLMIRFDARSAHYEMAFTIE